MAGVVETAGRRGGGDGGPAGAGGVLEAAAAEGNEDEARGAGRGPERLA